MIQKTLYCIRICEFVNNAESLCNYSAPANVPDIRIFIYENSKINSEEIMNKIYLTIRKITVAPIMAAVMLTILFIAKSEIFQSAFTYILSLFF